MSTSEENLELVILLPKQRLGLQACKTDPTRMLIPLMCHSKLSSWSHFFILVMTEATVGSGEGLGHIESHLPKWCPTMHIIPR